MTPYLRAGLAGTVFTFGALLAVVGIARHNDDTDPATATTPRGPYVALGDSYTAGPRIPDQTGSPAGCDRSNRNYPALVAAELGLQVADFRDMSCSAATVVDLLAPQSTDNGTNPAQMSALSSETRLVTIGIGGNDIGFSGVIAECVKAGLAGRVTGSGTSVGNDAPCRDRYVTGDGDEVKQRIDSAGRRISEALDEVKRRAAQARVYVVGYPALLPSQGAGCDDDMPLAPGDATYLDEKEQQLNAMLLQRAEAAEVGYVDTYKPSVGFDACRDRATRWVEPLLPRLPAAPMHPNERGERGMADAVLRAVRASGEQRWHVPPLTR
ncbi:SGNH/GDSL hydrolase family protein [Streptomyces sp. NPDC020802]|uniref:SGNH/GDSL hydrolase family protein n=1 Tax=Streptomyces sp. NPDC020802 TaxID=3365094 RepID=UPI0037A284A3